ncbi:hypothetical protein FJZ33_11990 [Candidatus Poribacteria bacterium]|nr:hypothetical protein [Candidatus Poribacteria bacterium]
MPTNELSVIEIKLAEPQMDFLEKKAKELGLSKEDLVKLYILSDMLKTSSTDTLENKPGKERISIKGMVRDGRVTDEDIEEVKREWNKLG